LAAYIKTVERIVAGDLRERSPACDGVIDSTDWA
jgi:hypothetical protein